MPRPRFSRLPVERQQQILEVAARRFAAEGFHGAPLNGILADAKVSKGAAYYYFDDKLDLFATVVEAAWAEVDADALFGLEGLNAETYWSTLERLYRRQLGLLSERPWLWRVVRAAGEVATDPRTGPALMERLGPIFSALQGVWTRGQALGLLRTDLPEGLLFAMVGALDQGIDGWFLEHPEAARGPEGEALLSLAFAALRRLAER